MNGALGGLFNHPNMQCAFGNFRLVVNVKQRPQPTRMACRRADFSRPWRVETRPTQGTHVSCFGVSLLNMDVSPNNP